MSQIYQYFFPRVQRYFQYRKSILLTEWNTSDGLMMPPLTLFDFQRPIDLTDALSIKGTSSVDRWTVSDDSVIHGLSQSRAVLIRTAHCWDRYIREGQVLQRDA
jgi:hypothetical protein